MNIMEALTAQAGTRFKTALHTGLTQETQRVSGEDERGQIAKPGEDGAHCDGDVAGGVGVWQRLDVQG